MKSLFYSLLMFICHYYISELLKTISSHLAHRHGSAIDMICVFVRDRAGTTGHSGAKLLKNPPAELE